MYHRQLAFLTFVALMQFEVMAKSHPYDSQFEKKVADIFLEEGKPSEKKISAYIQRLQNKKAELLGLLEGQLKLEGETDQKKISSKAMSNKIILGLNHAVKDLKALKDAKSEESIHHLAYSALDLEASIRVEGATHPVLNTLYNFKSFIGSWKIPKVSQAKDEASNLFDRSSNKYLTVAEIQDLKNKNVDLSSFGPGPRSTFFQEQNDISEIDVGEAALGRTLKPYKDLDFSFPEENIFYLDDVKHSSTKPKLNVHYLNSTGKKIKLKLKIGAEIHADPTVAALLMTMGFSTDITKHTRNIKVIFDRKFKMGDLKREWEVYYKRDAAGSANIIENYIKEQGETSDGRQFVIFKEGLLEAKPEKVERLGPWSFQDNSHSSMREVRGMMLVNMWLDNSDIKQFDNNQTLIRENKDGSLERHHIISDLGHSFGWIFYEKPEFYFSKMVARNSRREVELNFRSYHTPKVKNNISLADAQWGAKLIADLTRPQLEKATEIGGWPSCIADIYVEKMISRRNDLLSNLNLIGKKSHSGKTISLMTMTKSLEELDFDGVCSKEKINEEFTTDFDFDLKFLFGPMGSSIWNGLLDLARSRIGDANKIVINSPEFGLETSYITDIIINLKRDIERNEKPSSEEDLYIVKDHFEVGMRLGISFGVFKDYTYTRSFTLAYPARTQSEARMNNGFVVNALLPFDIRNNKLPKKYVLKTEHYFESGMGINADDRSTAVSLGMKTGRAKIKLLRTVLDHRDPDQYIMYREKSKMAENYLRSFVRVSLFKLPLFTTLSKWGTSVGYGSLYPAEVLKNDPELSQSLDKAMTLGDFSGLEKYETSFNLANDFRSNETGWRFLLWQQSHTHRSDYVRITPKDIERNSLQFRSERKSSWAFLGDKEEQNIKVELYADPQRALDLRLSIEAFSFDANSSDEEVADHYISFINNLSIDGKKLIRLDPRNGYTTNGQWGKTVTESKTTFYEEGMSKIINMSETEFWNAVGEKYGVSVSNMEILKVRYSSIFQTRNDSTFKNLNHILKQVGLTESQYQMVKYGREFLKFLNEFQRANDPSKKQEILAKAFRGTLYKVKDGFFEARMLGAMVKIAGISNVYSRNIISAPEFEEQKFVEEAPLFGEMGDERDESNYLIMDPNSPSDLYYMMDNWF